MKDGRDIRHRPCASLPELVIVGKTEIQQPLPRLEIPAVPGCLNLYLGYKGSKQMQAEGRTYTLTAGEFFLTPPGVDHRTGPMPISRCAHYWLRVDLSLPGAFLGSPAYEPLRLRLATGGVRHGRSGESLPAGVRALYDACAVGGSSGDAALWEAELRLQLGLVLVRLLAQIEEGSAATAEDPVMRRLLDHVDRHLGEDLSLQELAGVAGCSVSAMQALFKRGQGLSPGEYVARQRMIAAEALLMAGDLSLRAIAERLGFANDRHFSTAFRRFHGDPPGRFRERRNRST